MSSPSPQHIDLCIDEIREVTRFAARPAALALRDHPQDDDRARAAIDAALAFAGGAARTILQRTTALEAHRAATATDDQVAHHVLMACGDAAASAYLHPLAHATQVGHILRSTAHAACAAELAAERSDAAAAVLADAVRSASPLMLDILARYPSAPRGRTRVANLMNQLDTALRNAHT